MGAAGQDASIDGELQELSAGGVVTLSEPRTVYDRFRSKLFMARLRTLEAMQLARRERDGWRLSPAMEETLRGMGRRGDIIRSMEHAVGDRLSLHRLRDFAGETAPLRLIGRVIGSGAADDAHERRFLALDGADGNQWHVEVELKPGAMPPEGAIVEVSRGAGAPRKSDLTIAAIAERNGGVYSNELHEIADPRSTADHRLAGAALRRCSAPALSSARLTEAGACPMIICSAPPTSNTRTGRRISACCPLCRSKSCRSARARTCSMMRWKVRSFETVPAGSALCAARSSAPALA
ncbi:MAG: DUF3363 domain-containing protein [Parvularculaceae bacterium]